MYKLKSRILFIFILLFSISSYLLAYTNVTSFKPKYGTLTSRTNFRDKPSTSSSVISVLPKNTAVKMVGEISNFYIVQLANNQIGYVSKDYVKASNTAPSGAATYENLGSKFVAITGDSVNLRRGPATSFSKITKLKKGEKVKVIGKINDFYLAITENNTAGMISKSYVSFLNSGNATVSDTNSSTIQEKDEEYVLKLINDYREKNGVSKLSMGSKLLKMARIKADDMVKNSYFSHSSPTYGSPFEMMKNYGLNYKVAGENIAGNPSLEGAVNSWINSSTHRENLLSSSYNYAGIGIAKSSTYGYIVVAMFAGV